MSQLAEFFSREAGQQRRRALDEALSRGLNYYLGPTGIPQRLGALNQLFNPVVGMEEAGRATGQALDPSLPGRERLGALGRAALETAGVVAPGVAISLGGRIASGLPRAVGGALDEGAETASRGLSETLAGVSAAPSDGPLALPAPTSETAGLLPRPYGPDSGLGTAIYRPGMQFDANGRPTLDVNATIFQGEENQRLLNGGLTNREMEAARLAELRAEGAPTALDAPDVIPLGGPLHSMAPRDEETGLMFSRALQSAIDLQQRRGTVQQLRSQLLRAGTRPEELEFRGFDLAFQDPNQRITRDELVDFFRAQDGDVVQPEEFRAGGGRTTGRDGEDPMDADELANEYVERNIEGEADFYRNEYFPERLQEEYSQVRDLNAEELEELAQSQGYDDVDEFYEAHEDDWVIDDDLFDDEARAAEVAFGDPYQLAEESLRENVAYNMTTDELREALGYDPDELFDPGDTTYSRYMLPGLGDYFERVYMTDLPGGGNSPVDLSVRRPYTGGHGFNHDTPDQAFWARGGYVPQMEGGPDNVRAVMEIQSDLSQRSSAPGSDNARRPPRRTLAEDLEYSALENTLAGTREVADTAYGTLAERLGVPFRQRVPSHYATEAALRDAFTAQIPDADGLVDLAGRGQRQAEGILPDLIQREVLRQNFTLPEGVERGDLPPPYRGATWDPNPVRQRDTDLPVDPTFPDNRQFEMMVGRTADGGRELLDWRAQIENIERRIAEGTGPSVAPDPQMAQDLFTRRLSRAGELYDPQDADIGGDGISIGFATPGQPRFPAGFDDYNRRMHRYPVEDLAEAMSPLRQIDPDQPLLPLDYAPETENMGATLQELRNARLTPEERARYEQLAGGAPSAPFQRRDVGPIRGALLRELAQAVHEGDRALVTGTGEMASDFTMLPASKHYVYDRETPRQLQQILDEVAPGTQVEPITVNMPDAPGADHRGQVQLMGVRLTPEVRRAIEYNGIPYFSVGGGMIALGAPGTLGPRREEEDQS